MRFLNPAGLWLLLGVPVLIAVYLIRSQHEDRPVSSTYIWRLSSRFMKKRLPMQKLRKILMFILQLAVIVTIALLAARPAAISGEACDYIAVIDASASMQIRDEEGISRFEYALGAVRELADKVNEGHTVSVIIAGAEPCFLVRQSTSVNEIRLALQHAECTLGEADISAAAGLADSVLRESACAELLLYSDCGYSADNVQLVNLNRGEWNVEIASLSAAEKNAETVFTAELISYNAGASVTVGLRIDGTVTDAQLAECPENTPTEVSFTLEETEGFDTAEVFIEADDGLAADNSFAVCRKSERTYGILLVSASPLYLESALNALGNCSVTVVSSADEALLSGQDLYIFDGIAPEEFPTDGSVLLFGTGSLPDGLTAGETSASAAALRRDSALVSEIYSGLSLGDTVIASYTELLGGAEWEKLLFCEDAAVLVSKETENGMRFTVASFDVHDSNLPMQADFVVLMRNLVNYSVPELIKSTDYSVGDTVKLNVLPAAENLYLEYPDDTVRVLSAASRSAAVTVNEVGIYTAVMSGAGGGEYADFFVHIPVGEIGRTDGGTVKAETAANTGGEAKEALAGLWTVLALCALALVLTEWWWYYREQY